MKSFNLRYQHKESTTINNFLNPEKEMVFKEMYQNIVLLIVLFYQ